MLIMMEMIFRSLLGIIREQSGHANDVAQIRKLVLRFQNGMFIIYI
jgi:hypothetical protein